MGTRLLAALACFGLLALPAVADADSVAGLTALGKLAQQPRGVSRVVAALRWGYLEPETVALLSRLDGTIEGWTSAELAVLGEYPGLISLGQRTQVTRALTNPSPHQSTAERAAAPCGAAGDIGELCTILGAAARDDAVVGAPTGGSPGVMEAAAAPETPLSPTNLEAIGRAMDELTDGIYGDNAMDATSGAVFVQWERIATALRATPLVSVADSQLHNAAADLIAATDAGTPSGAPGYRWFRPRDGETPFATIYRHAQQGIVTPDTTGPAAEAGAVVYDDPLDPDDIRRSWDALDADLAASNRQLNRLRYGGMIAAGSVAVGIAVWSDRTED